MTHITEGCDEQPVTTQTTPYTGTPPVQTSIAITPSVQIATVSTQVITNPHLPATVVPTVPTTLWTTSSSAESTPVPSLDNQHITNTSSSSGVNVVTPQPLVIASPAELSQAVENKGKLYCYIYSYIINIAKLMTVLLRFENLYILFCKI